MRLAIACRQVRGVTGTARTVLEHSRRFSALGWEVHVYGDELDAEALRRDGAITHGLPRWPWSGYLRRRAFSWMFERAARGFDLTWGHGDVLSQDILSLHNCVHAAHEALRGSALPESSSVARIHGPQLRERRFRRLIANSRLMRDDLVRRFGIDSGLIDVIYPGHDPARLAAADPAALRARVRGELGFSEGDFVFGLITSGDFEKRGVGVFSEALARCRRSSPASVKGLVLGKGSVEGVRHLPLTPEVGPYFRALDAYVHPAYFEEFGQSVQEAMACGLPVLATKAVGACELMGPEARSWLIARPDAQELADRMARLAADPATARRMGRDNADAVRLNDWEENFRRSLECCRRVLAEKRATMGPHGA